MQQTQPIGLRILGTGEYQPRTRIASAELDRRWGQPDGWTQRHSGIASRCQAAPDETGSVMAAAASRQALAAAGIEAVDLDCIISACAVMEQPIPCQGALVQRELGQGRSGIPAFDINATCLSFLVALDTAAMAIAMGRYRRVLVVSSEIASAGLPTDAPATAMLFGDGAGAVVLSAVDDAVDAAAPALLAARFETYGDGAAHCEVRAGGTRLRVHDDPVAFAKNAVFRMDGRATYRMAKSLLPPFMAKLLAAAGVRVEDLAAIVPHQASGKALSHLEVALGLPDGQLVRILETHGNQMAASIPVALHRAIQSGRIRRGDTIGLVGSGAGLSFGGVVLRY